MFNNRKVYLVLLIGVAILLVASLGTVAAGPGLSPEEELGKAIFFDENLSINQNQSCILTPKN